MSDKFKNRYRIESARLRHWDYGWNAAYFVTICTRNRECFFGAVVNGEMQLSETGKIAESEWLKTPEIRLDMNIVLDAFVVMPNHFHGVIIIGENEFNKRGGGNPCVDGDRDDGGGDGDGGRAAMHCVSTGVTPNTVNKTNPAPQNRFGPQRKNLASIMRGFKSAVTQQARMIDPGFAWQPRFHDHIIRDEKSFDRIKQYIMNNPALWQKDVYHE